MCIAKPMRVVEVRDNTAVVEIGGDEHTIVDISLVDVTVGDYVIANMGFAIQVMSAEEALESLELWEKLAKHNENN